MFQGIITIQHTVNGKGSTYEISDVFSGPCFGQFLSVGQPAPLHACYQAELVMSVREDVHT